MELQLLVLREKKNMFLARPISERQRGADMAFIPDRILEHPNIVAITRDGFT